MANYLFGQVPVTVADGSFKIASFSEEEFYFGFAEGDEFIFTLEEQKGKDVKEVEIIEYPSTSRYIEFKKNRIAKSITIPSTGIYKFRINNGSIGGRICSYKIERKPASSEIQNFNTNVYWETRHDTTYVQETETYLVRQEYVPKVIVPVSEFYINSGSNALLLGGSSRVTVPVNLPGNTVKWFYEFSAFREEEQILQVKESYSLLGDLLLLLSQQWP